MCLREISLGHLVGKVAPCHCDLPTVCLNEISHTKGKAEYLGHISQILLTLVNWLSIYQVDPLLGSANGPRSGKVSSLVKRTDISNFNYLGHLAAYL